MHFPNDTHQTYEPFTFPRPALKHPYQPPTFFPNGSLRSNHNQPGLPGFSPTGSTGSQPGLRAPLVSPERILAIPRDEEPDGQVQTPSSPVQSPSFPVQSGSPPAQSSSPPVLNQVGDKTPPGTLEKPVSRSSSVRDWCSRYSQAYLSRTIDTEENDEAPSSKPEVDSSKPEVQAETAKKDEQKPAETTAEPSASPKKD